MPITSDFTLTLHAAPGGYELSAHGPGEIAIPPRPLPTTLAERLRQTGALRLDAALSLDQVQSAGAVFFEALFPPPVASAFAAAEQLVASQGGRLRLAIYPPELNALPWELLYHPGEDRFLAALLTRPLLRYIESPAPVASLRAEKPLRLLYVQSLPADLPPLDLQASERALRQGLGDAAEIVALRQPTRQALADALRQPFHALHYDGHAWFDKAAGVSAIQLVDERGAASALSAAELAYALNGTSVRLVTLAACRSGMDARRARFAGIAHELMKASSLPAVVAMQAAISDTAAIAFTRGFYRALADEYPLDAALIEGRKAILSVAGGDFANGEWATPVLFLRGDGGLFAAPEDAPAPGLSPYKVLQYFDESDAELFFGREQLSQELAERLRVERFLAIVGASGSGKSSLERAGLLPRLRQAGGWSIVPPFTPGIGAEPLLALAGAVMALLEPELGEVARLAESRKLAASLRSGEIGLRDVAGRILQKEGTARLALVVDQFEELFTAFREKTQLQAEFIELLLAAANGDSPVSVVITLRADFYAGCAQFAGLRAALEQHQAFIGPMAADELRQAIEEPARRGNWPLEDGLADLLLHDVGDEPGNLPLLSHALRETWQRRKGRLLTLRGYQQSGGVRGAIARSADAALLGLDDRQLAIVQRIFLELTELGEGTQDTRRRTTLEEIAPRAGERPAAAEMLRMLAGARLVTLDERAVEVAHEALIREWPALRRWLDERRAGLRLHRELNEAAKDWETLNRDAGALYRGARLAAAAEWAQANRAELTDLQAEFLSASQQAVEEEVRAREAQRQRELEQVKRLAQTQRQHTTVLAAGLAIALLLTVVALWFVRAANLNLEQANAAGTQAARNLQVAQENAATAEAEAISRATAQSEAEGQRDRARAGELASIALSHLEDQLDLALLLGVEANRTADIYLSQNALLSTIQVHPELIAMLHNPGIIASRVAFSPDGKYLVLSGIADTVEGREQQGRILAWELDSLTLAAELWLPDGMATDITFDAQGRFRAFRYDGTIATWILPDPQPVEVATYNIETGSSFSHNGFNSQGNLITAASYDTSTVFWNAESGEKLAEFPVESLAGTPLNYPISCWSGLIFHPTENWAACSEADRTYLLDLENAELLQTFALTPTETMDPEMYDGDMVFSPDGRTLLVEYYEPYFSGANKIVAWDLESGLPLATSDLSYEYFASGLVIDSKGQIVAQGWELGVHLFALTYSPSSLYYLGDLNVPVPMQTTIKPIAFSPDGQILAGLLDDGRVLLWDVAPVQLMLTEDITGYKTFLPPGEIALRLPMQVTSAAFSPDQTILAVNHCQEFDDTGWQRKCLNSVLQLFRLPGGEALGDAIAVTEGMLLSLSFSADGKNLAGLRCPWQGWDGKCEDSYEALLWRLDNGQLRPVPLAGDTQNLTEIIFSPDGETLVAGGYAVEILFWDTQNGQEEGNPIRLDGLLASPDGNSYWLEPINSLAFSPDGSLLAVGGCMRTADGSAMPCQRGVIYLVDVNTNSMIGNPIWAQENGLFQIAFSADGNRLIAAGCKEFVLWDDSCGDEEIRIWDLATRKPFGQPMGNYGSSMTLSKDGILIASTSSWASIGALGGWGGYYPDDYFSPYLVIWDALVQRTLGAAFMAGEFAFPPVAMVFTPDGQALLSIDSSGAIVRWNLDTDFW